MLRFPDRDTEEQSFPKAFLQKLRKRRIIETLAAFIGGGWMLLEFVHWLPVDHWHFPEKTIDITFITILGTLVVTLIWRWFRSSEKRPGNVKIEVLVVPLIILATAAIDLTIIFQITGISIHTLLLGGVALVLGIVWVILKLSQWAAAAAPSSPASPDAQGTGLLITLPAQAGKSIVVLPFTDLSPQKDQEYFCDGMTEEIITDLSHIHGLRVISRNSAMMLKGTPKDTGTISRDLNVHYVLEGSVRKAGKDLKITAQLIDALNDAHLWADKYDGTLDDVFDIQEKVARSIGEALKFELTPEEKGLIVARPITSPEAYDLHIMARHEAWRATEQGLEYASRLVKKGLELIGDNETLYADLGFINLLFMDAGIKKDGSVLAEAERCVQKVFALNPDSAYGHYLRGMILRKRRDLRQAVKEFRRSLAKDPNHPDALMWLGWVYAHSGRIAEARRLVQRLSDIDPLNLLTFFLNGAVEVLDGEFEKGIKGLGHALQMDEKNPFVGSWLSRSLSYAQCRKEAQELSLRIENEAPGSVWSGLVKFFDHAQDHEESMALRTVESGLGRLARDDEMFPVWMAEAYALIGKSAEAVDWLANAVDCGFINYPFLSTHDPFFGGIRGDAGFQKLMERVKYEWEHFEV